MSGKTVIGVDGFVNRSSSLFLKPPLVVLALDHRTGKCGYVRATVIQQAECKTL